MKQQQVLGLLAGVTAMGGALAGLPVMASGDAAGGAPAPKAFKLDYQETRLDNGLRVILVERHHAPVVTVNVTYNVGSRDEREGRTGFAHLFEHMMFQGSENVGKAEHFALISSYGGSMNGSTSYDRTNYFQTLPANQLELGLFLEADRMKSLDVSQENLDNQRAAVQEEKRLNYDNRPYGNVRERLMALAYDNFAYRHITIGSMADLNAATLDDVRQFFKTYYAPNNAVLVIVGDFQPAKAMELVRKHFGGIAAQPAPVIPDLSEKLNKGERVGDYQDPLARLPRVDMVYPTVAGNHPDYFALDVMSTILGGGESSRLYQKLVKESQVAVNVSAGVWDLRGPGPLMITAVAAPGKDLAAVQLAVDAEIARMASEPVSEAELARTKTSMRASILSQFETGMYTSIVLGQAAVYYGSPAMVNDASQAYQAVTVADVQRVAQTYLQTKNRGVLRTVPAPKPAAPAAPTSPK